MKINSVDQSRDAIHSVSKLSARPLMHSGGPNLGILSDSDIAMIKAVTKTDFNWPPAEGEGFPQAAADLAMVRVRQRAENSTIGQLNAKNLLALGRVGDLDPEFVSKAIEYLKDGQVSGTTERTDLRSRRPFESAPTSGERARDGSLYL